MDTIYFSAYMGENEWKILVFRLSYNLMETPYVCYGNNCVTSLPLVVPACFYLLQQIR